MESHLRVALSEILLPAGLGFLNRWNGEGLSFLEEEGSWESLVGWHSVPGPVLDAGDTTVTKHNLLLPKLPF